MNNLLSSPNTKKNIALSGLKAIISAVPIASAFGTFCNEFINTNWQERIERTQTEILTKLSELDKEFEEKLRNKPNISSVLGSIYQSALSDIDEDKIPYYVNSLVNAIKDESLDNTKLYIFINCLKECTLLHIMTLKYFSKQNYDTSSMQMNCFSIPTHEEVITRAIEQTNPELVKDIDLLDMIILDLHRKGLLKISGLKDLGISTFKNIPKQTTSLGDEFIEFFEDNEE